MGVKQESGESDEYLHQAAGSLSPSGPRLKRQRRSRSSTLTSRGRNRSNMMKILLGSSSPGGGAAAAAAQEPLLLSKDCKRKRLLLQLAVIDACTRCKTLFCTVSHCYFHCKMKHNGSSQKINSSKLNLLQKLQFQHQWLQLPGGKNNLWLYNCGHWCYYSSLQCNEMVPLTARLGLLMVSVQLCSLFLH